ncbi:hypothetical protein BU25DRAFT_454772 [Macroventuria anomochaeta]|uniref:Uncharacterized protein n=1 Tax=Macroventuria anomochaeta TaxID=301207 RepID=A0ACB6SEN8_9PLEO|nr:uncharacterized protein BU25DRAFT_454772 [Macroventuria anomochaeta]KAF2632447.1 hypothetical protein BU25DRAFT_454772 [Macroventuria anomochaeta]
MHQKNERHDESVKVLRLPRLAVWVHDYKSFTSTRTVSTLVFAALNRDITEGSISTNLPIQKDNDKIIKKISVVACDVDLEFIEGILTIGEVTNGAPLVAINTLADSEITAPESGSGETRWNPIEHPKNTLNELVLCSRVNESNDQWNMTYIENFIEAFISVSILGDSNNFNNGDVRTLASYSYVLKLQSPRCKLLMVSPMIILINGAILLIMILHLHHKLRIPVLRLATPIEILKSAQTDHLSCQAANDMLKPTQPSQLEKIKVRFDVNNSGLWGLSCLDDDTGLLGDSELLKGRSLPGSTVTLEYQCFQR